MAVTASPGSVGPSSASVRRHPSTAGYWLGGLLTGAAVIGAVIWVVVGFFDYRQQINRYQRLTVPGAADVQVTRTATRVVYYEDSRGSATPTLSQLGLTVTDPTGTPLAVTAYEGDMRYDVPGATGRVGRAVAEFHPKEVGDYQVRSAPTTRVTGTVAIGGDIVWNIAPYGIGAGALFLLGGGAGVVILVVAAVRRSNAHR